MNYEEFLNKPGVHKEFDKMFESERNYYRHKSMELGIDPNLAELFSIKIAHVSTELYFAKQFYSELDEVSGSGKK